MDEKAAVDPLATDNDIIKRIKEEHADKTDEDVEEEGMQAPSHVSLQVAVRSIAALRRFYNDRGMSDYNVDVIEQELAGRILHHSRQTLITDFLQ